MAASDAQFVIGAVTENLDLKQNIFKELDLICPEETFLATNTSVISIMEIAEKAQKSHRILGIHFGTPPI